MFIGWKALLFHCISLVIGCWINVTKAASGRICVGEWIARMVDDSNLGVMHCFSGGDFCCPDVCDVGTAIPSVSLLKLTYYIRITDLFGKPGLKTLESDPRQPFGLSPPGGPATPLSPDAKKIETPRIPSFINLYQKRQS